MEDGLIYSKAIDKSILTEGFALPTAILEDFSNWFGLLSIGEKKEIKVLLDGKEYPVFVKNQVFSREKYPTHKEIFQVRYSPNGEFSNALKNVFHKSYSFISSEYEKLVQERMNGGKRRNIVMPTSIKEFLAFYRTEDPFVWKAEPITQCSNDDMCQKISKAGLSEEDVEHFMRTDENAEIVKKIGLVRIRKLDRDICNQLKVLYSNSCQICGARVGDGYGKALSEGHHIIPFSKSLNNDSSNIIVVCPNHHRIIHACNPEYRRSKKEFVYPNGLHEGLLLNKHL